MSMKKWSYRLCCKKETSQNAILANKFSSLLMSKAAQLSQLIDRFIRMTAADRYFFAPGIQPGEYTMECLPLETAPTPSVPLATKIPEKCSGRVLNEIFKKS